MIILHVYYQELFALLQPDVIIYSSGKRTLKKLNLLSCVPNNRKAALTSAIILTVLLIIDLLSTRQILYPTGTYQTALFILIVICGYGVASWILLENTRRLTKDLRSRSRLMNTMHWGVTIVQFFTIWSVSV